MRTIVNNTSGSLSTISIDKSWSLFLDRDGIINEKLENDYVKTWDEFAFKEGVLQAIAGLGKLFGRILVVTNQRGVGLGLMTEENLKEINDKMCREVIKAHGKIDKVYYCTGVDNSSECRKPNIGMGLEAKRDFPEIDFSKSVIIGDSPSDMEFGRKLGMLKVFIGNESESIKSYDFYFYDSLISFYKSVFE